MAYDANTDYRARQNQLKKQMEGTTDAAEKAQLQAQWDAADLSRTEKLASNLSKYGKWASDSELDSAAGLMAERQIGTGFETQKQNLNQSYDQAKQNAQNSALSRGMARSSFIQDREANLDSKRADALSQVDIAKAQAIQNAKANIINNYQTNEANRLAAEKAEFAQNIGAYRDNYESEVERILNDGDPSNDWQATQLRAAGIQWAREAAGLNMQYGDFSGAGSMGLSPEAIANAQKMWGYDNRNALAPTYSYGGGYRNTTSNKELDKDPDKDPVTPAFSGNQGSPSLLAGYSPRGTQVLAQAQAMLRRGVPSKTVMNEVRRAMQAGAITQSDANRILGAVGL